MHICITGMHRSGTSMITRLLSMCGLYLGSESDFIKADIHNQGGYWENKRFVTLSDKILLQLGGSWYFPPSVSEGWEGRSELTHLKNEALSIIDEYRNHEFWGWKDPRSCLTVPFWTSVAPSPKFIICLRNPIEVAKSFLNYGFSYEFGLHLWLYYNTRLLGYTKYEQRIITHYHSYFYHPQEELSRILDFLGWSVSIEDLGQACKSINNSLRHYCIADLNEHEHMPLGLSDLYKKMGNNAGAVYQQVFNYMKNHEPSHHRDKSAFKKRKTKSAIKQRGGVHAKTGDTIMLNFICKIQDGTLFDSSVMSSPQIFKIGGGRLIPIIQKAVIGMREGEIKTFKCSANEAFGPYHALSGKSIIFDVQIVKIF
jgi:FKBP-type peptidyl-prolyl cis-trans isomerase